MSTQKVCVIIDGMCQYRWHVTTQMVHVNTVFYFSGSILVPCVFSTKLALSQLRSHVRGGFTIVKNIEGISTDTGLTQAPAINICRKTRSLHIRIQPQHHCTSDISQTLTFSLANRPAASCFDCQNDEMRSRYMLGEAFLCIQQAPCLHGGKHVRVFHKCPHRGAH